MLLALAFFSLAAKLDLFPSYLGSSGQSLLGFSSFWRFGHSFEVVKLEAGGSWGAQFSPTSCELTIKDCG